MFLVFSTQVSYIETKNMRKKTSTTETHLFKLTPINLIHTVIIQTEIKRKQQKLDDDINSP